jgi:GT2 family glycosyltransferase
VSSTTPDVAVVIVNWNAGRVLLDCLESLERHPPTVPWEAIVVDNGSTDGSVAALARNVPWAQVIANRENRGLAAANNQGIAAARAPEVVICNPDVLFRPRTIDALRETAARHDRAAFVVARLLHPDGSLQTGAGDLPTLADALLGRQAARRRATDGQTHGFWWDGWDHGEERPIGHGAEACYLVRTEALADIGLQDEGYLLDWEGLDWSARAWDAGWEIWFCPAAEAMHLGGVSVRQAPARWVVQSHRGMYRYFKSRRRRTLRPLLWVAFTARAALKLLGVAARLPLHERALRGGRASRG